MSSEYRIPDKVMPTVRPDEVKGYMGQSAAAAPDRRFHVLENARDAVYIWEIDGYRAIEKDGKVHWRLHMICPRCDRSLTIVSTKKPLEVREGPNGGLEVEAFQCSWPGDFGSPCCSFAAGIRLPRGSERVQGVDGGTQPFRIDGVLVPA